MEPRLVIERGKLTGNDHFIVRLNGDGPNRAISSCSRIKCKIQSAVPVQPRYAVSLNSIKRAKPSGDDYLPGSVECQSGYDPVCTTPGTKGPIKSSIQIQAGYAISRRAVIRSEVAS